MRLFKIAETAVWPDFFLMNVFFSLKGSKLFIIICTTIYYFRYTKVDKQAHKFINAVCVYISLIGSCIVSFMFDCSYLDSLIALS